MFEPVSESVTLTVAVPHAFAAGVKVRLPDASICGGAANDNVETIAVMVALNVSACPASSSGPELIAVAHPDAV